MTRNERIELLVEAQELLGEVIDKIGDAVADTSTKTYTNTYLLAHLRSWMNTDDYLTSDEGINDLINKMENGEIDIYDEEE